MISAEDLELIGELHPYFPRMYRDCWSYVINTAGGHSINVTGLHSISTDKTGSYWILFARDKGVTGIDPLFRDFIWVKYDSIVSMVEAES